MNVVRQPISSLILTTIHNGGGNTLDNSIDNIYFRNQCFYISIVNILRRTGIAPNVTVQHLRYIGGLDPMQNNQMWDSNQEMYRNALTRICTYFNIEVRILSSTMGTTKYVSGDASMLHPIPISDFPYGPTQRDPGSPPPVEVYIAHSVIHFEAVQMIMDSDGVIMYDLDELTTRVIHEIDIEGVTKIIRQLLHSNAAAPRRSTSTSIRQLSYSNAASRSQTTKPQRPSAGTPRSSTFSTPSRSSIGTYDSDLERVRQLSLDTAEEEEQLRIATRESLESTKSPLERFYDKIISGKPLTENEQTLYTLYELLNDSNTRISENLQKIRDQEPNTKPIPGLDSKAASKIKAASMGIIKKLETENAQIEELTKIYMDHIVKTLEG